MNRLKDSKALGHFLAIFTIFVWGTTFISTKVLLREFNSTEIVCFRLLIGFVVLFCMKPKIMKFQSLKKELMYLAAAVCGVSVYQILENLALSYSYASTTSVIISAAPLFTAILASIVFKTKCTLRFFIGFVIAISGIIFVNINKDMGFNLKGVLVALAAVCMWAVYSVLGKFFTGDGISVIQVTRRIFLYGIIVLIPFWFIFDCRFGFERFANPVNLLNMLFLGGVASALCFVTWNSATKRIGVVPTGVYMYGIPVVTVIFSIIILDEGFTYLTAIGIVLTLGGLFVSSFKYNRRRQ